MYAIRSYYDICVNNGLVMRAVGDTMIVSPPLIVTDAHIDELVDKRNNFV